jgi:hypothetical protein
MRTPGSHPIYRHFSFMKHIEAKCSIELQNWDGNIESVSEVKRLSHLMLTEDPIPIT